MNNRGRWRIGALASAIALLGSLASLEAHAMALGRITVQSALGEPLRAEIEVADITAEEAASLKAGVAPADAFKAAGFEYTAAVSGLEVKLQRRADGRAFLRLTSSRPVTEPFVDLILEANWSSGRITRDYTMLFDPPNLRAANAAAAVAPTAPILSRPAAPNLQPIQPTGRAVAASPPAAASPPPARPAPTVKVPAVKVSPAEKAPADNKQITVKTGDTAGKIAAQNKPASVSLDQMLVALLKGNPDAFIAGNVNRIKAGAVLDVPGAQAASAISVGEASQTIVAQSKDFNAFRRKLAEGVPSTQVAGADRQAAGKVQAKVEDRASANSAPDKLTLSKGSIQGKSGAQAEDKIVKDRQAQDASTRLAELSKNINDLNKLGIGPGRAEAPAADAVKAPGVTVPAPSSLAVPATIPALAASSAAASSGAAAPAVVASAAALAPPVTPVASTTASSSTATATIAPASAPSSVLAPVVAASAPVAAASNVVAATSATKPLVKVETPTDASLLDEWLENPLTKPLAAGLLVLLAGFGLYRYRRRNRASQIDSSFLESRLQPDSFFGASGGQHVDTKEGNATGSSLVYSPSQLDAAGDVDPVAEADVYLAYGRDLQAEEILKEAVRTSPKRVAIHAKLLEIYAKRSDSKAFENVALDAFNLTQGFGPEWAHITELGRELDPANPMYLPGGQPLGNVPASGAAFSSASLLAHLDSTDTPPVTVPPSDVDVDLDLDFSLDETPDMGTMPAPFTLSSPPALLQTPELPEAMKPILNLDDLDDLDLDDLNLDDLDMDFDNAKAAPPAAGPVNELLPEISFPSNGLDFSPEPLATASKPVAASKPELPPAAVAPAPVAADSGMLEFDLSSLSLDLHEPATDSLPIADLVTQSDDPLETKFLLAEEFRSLGDPDGARALAEEVLAKAAGPLKVKAQAFLSALS
ncbi:FimV/HubP family polar landmark protein [Polaromonas sp.]|uniref:FimV/HubP family polar landmark protein n=1 Tax=Polaromonas sp. TaxID=1869339 RepID=UPI0017CF940C|nr:FimV/HubP family polar landmark protein [Polaromonas sp.]NMM05461.1 fimbrial protein FimV [Polaromonas sp.]